MRYIGGPAQRTPYIWGSSHPRPCKQPSHWDTGSPSPTPQLCVSNKAHPRGRGAPSLQDPLPQSWPVKQHRSLGHHKASAVTQHARTHTELFWVPEGLSEIFDSSALCPRTRNEKCVTYSWYLFFICKYLPSCHKINSTLDSNTFQSFAPSGEYMRLDVFPGKNKKIIKKMLKNPINL